MSERIREVPKLAGLTYVYTLTIDSTATVSAQHRLHPVISGPLINGHPLIIIDVMATLV